MRVVLHDVLRLTQKDVILDIVLEIAPALGGRVAIVEFQFTRRALHHGIAAVGIDEQAVARRGPHERPAGIALLPGLHRSSGVVAQELAVAIKAGVAAQAVHVLTGAADKAHAVVEHAAALRLPEQYRAIGLFHGHSARISLNGDLHGLGRDGDRVAGGVDLCADRLPDAIRIDHGRRSAGGNAVRTVIDLQNVRLTNLKFQDVIARLRTVIDRQGQGVAADRCGQHIAERPGISIGVQCFGTEERANQCQRQKGRAQPAQTDFS